MSGHPRDVHPFSDDVVPTPSKTWSRWKGVGKGMYVSGMCATGWLVVGGWWWWWWRDGRLAGCARLVGWWLVVAGGWWGGLAGPVSGRSCALRLPRMLAPPTSVVGLRHRGTLGNCRKCVFVHLLTGVNINMCLAGVLINRCLINRCTY
jgi:hypothetical protein